MPITGTFGGFPFDPEVYQGFVDQEATFSDSILASGILANDQSMASALDNGGVQGTIRFYNPLTPIRTLLWCATAWPTTVPTETLRRQAELDSYRPHEGLESHRADP